MNTIDLIQRELNRQALTEQAFSGTKVNSNKYFSALKTAWGQYRQDLEAGKPMDPYITDWSRYMSPIEDKCWQSIRAYGLPLYPQYPVGRFFADFADPHKKIIVEADGKAFHNPERDIPRDRELLEDGWLVYRVTGAECSRVPKDVDDSDASEADSEFRARQWIMNTSDGLFYALLVVIYKRSNPSPWIYNECVKSLYAHMTEAC